jgi:xylulokinase
MGKVTKEAAAVLGLLEGTPVVTGGGDGMMGTVGAGMAEPGDAYVNLGTSSWVSAIIAEPVFDPKQRTTNSPYLKGLYTSGGVMQSGGGAYSWCKSTLGAKEIDIAAEKGVSVYRLLDKLAADSPLGSNGVIFLPQLVGERAPFWNADAKGAFLGLRMEHTRGDMIRAVLEGVVLHLTIITDVMRSNGAVIDKVVAIGGGAVGEIWPQMLADAMNAAVLLPKAVEGATSMGAAITAAVGVGIYPEFKSAMKKFVPIVRKYEPDPAKTLIYDKSKQLYLDCYYALEKLYPRFNTLGKAD